MVDIKEVRFETARSSGPGGQHVNKVSTQVTLRFNVEDSRTLSAAQKRVLRRKLKSRISKDGILWVRSGKYRSQFANKKAVLERFKVLLAEALRPRKLRIKTKAPRSAIERRIQQKKRRGQLKNKRRPVRSDD